MDTLAELRRIELKNQENDAKTATEPNTIAGNKIVSRLSTIVACLSQNIDEVSQWSCKIMTNFVSVFP